MSVIEDLAAIDITYRRGVLSQAGTGVLGASQANAIEGAAATMELDLVSVIVARDFPDFGAGWTEPEPEDTIEFVDPMGVTRSLLVMRLNPGEPPWKFIDSSQTRILIHAAFVEEMP